MTTLSSGDLELLEDAASLVGKELLDFALNPDMNKARPQQNSGVPLSERWTTTLSEPGLKFHEALGVALKDCLDVKANPIPAKDRTRDAITQALKAAYKEVNRPKPLALTGTCVVCMDRPITSGFLHQDTYAPSFSFKLRLLPLFLSQTTGAQAVPMNRVGSIGSFVSCHLSLK